jgi:hypothetical protein
VGLASRGQRDMDDGPAAITNADVDAKIRRQARVVYVRSLITALALTALALAIPARS